MAYTSLSNKFVTLLALFFAGTSVARRAHIISKEHVQKVKQAQKAMGVSSWKSYDYEHHPFKDVDMSLRMGLVIPESAGLFSDSPLSIFSQTFKSMMGFDSSAPKLSAKRVYRDVEKAEKLGIPASWDWRTQNAACIHSVRNQEECGSCWAFSSTGMLEDRFCLASGGAINVRLSPEDMVGCDVGNMGCQGGMLSATIDFLTTEGAVDETCKPYVSGVGVNGFCHF